MKKGYDIIIQARLDSTRLPNKVMLDLAGLSIINWVYRGVKNSRLKDKIIFAIPNSKKNDLLYSYLKNNNYNVLRGPNSNVLKRFMLAAIKYKSSKIIRVCADNPFVSGKEIDNLIRFYDKNSCDYAYNHKPLNNLYPDGLGAEIIDIKVLKSLYKIVKKKKEKEHIFNYIITNKNKYKIATFNPLSNKLRHPQLKLDIDTFDDLNRFTKIVNNNNKISTDTLIKRSLK
tara:strand:- start:61 stop:747 length:687 start_codon:yes stop_codon:yes gene_type:complete